MVNRETSFLERTLPIFLIMVTSIVVVFLAQLILDMRAELKDMKIALATMKTNGSDHSTTGKHFTMLEEKCTQCHSERKFAGLHGSSSDISKVLEAMKAMPDAQLSQDDVHKIHSTLETLKCIKCHDEKTLKKLATLRPEQRSEIIEKMAEKPGSSLAPNEVKEIQDSLEKMQGF